MFGALVDGAVEDFEPQTPNQLMLTNQFWASLLPWRVDGQNTSKPASTVGGFTPFSPPNTDTFCLLN